MSTPTDELMDEHRVIERMLKVLSVAADSLEKDEQRDGDAFVRGVDFLRNFADRCHHGKEEQLLFRKMVERGLSGETGPIAVMLREHEDGRAHVRKIDGLSRNKLTGKAKDQMLEHVRGYVELLTAHIQKEDNILYPMANQILTKEDQDELEKGFAEVEQKTMGPGVHEKYHHMIEELEKKYQ